MKIKPDEKRIIKGCRAGKPKYQQLLYESYYGKMLSVCLRYSKNYEEARDILQEGYIKVFKSIKDFKGDGSLEGWIRRIMVNTAINFYHKNKKYDLNSSLDDEHQDSSPFFASEEQIIERMSYEDLLTLVRALPPAYQTVFNLYAIEGYSHREIADMLGISEGTSKSNLAKARGKLQKQIDRLMNDKTCSRYA